ncbi:hypothetical protein MF271_04970 [Deinococcus sp. KNUC1210]|uniref:hypothetical protein n=1 Tax=Deinococcus sp. KNUC1210 TaxID=2917691 RepID=UPI001EF0F458|nr:hypothetical protein [Deinococcus sp. KNUC1210]ULH15987.1 hypothetical protein MF271_04970 [Deinococcus sp. KNUC1210]
MSVLTTHSFLALTWHRVRLSSTNTGTNDVQGVLSQEANWQGTNANNQFVLLTGSNPAVYKARGVAWDQTGTARTVVAAAGAVADNDLIQLGMSVVYGSGNAVISVYYNGAQVGQTTYSGMTSLQAGGTRLLLFGAHAMAQNKGRSLRALIEDLTGSGRTPLTLVQQDYAANLARF